MFIAIGALTLFLLVTGIVSAGLTLRDGLAKRRRLDADVQDGMPNEIENLPSRPDGSTGPV